MIWHEGAAAVGHWEFCWMPIAGKITEDVVAGRRLQGGG